jgi:hypothetical protein
MFYAQCDNKGSMYKLEVKIIDDVNSACACQPFVFTWNLFLFCSCEYFGLSG